MSDDPDSKDDAPEGTVGVQAAFLGVMDDVLEALEGGTEDIEEISRRLFGASPVGGFEEAVVQHAKRSAEIHEELGDHDTGGDLEDYVRLSFAEARGELSAAETARLGRLEKDLRTDLPSTKPVPEVDAEQFIREWNEQNPAPTSEEPDD